MNPTHPRVLDPTTSVLVVIDVQEAYRERAWEAARLLRKVATLIEVAKVVEVPVVITEQYPRGLGSTMPEVAGCLPEGLQPIEKRSLSCWGASAFATRIEELGRRQIVVAGLETHACVNQTIHDLIHHGYQVHLPVDAVSSRFEPDHRAGLEKLLGSGAVPATVEMVGLEWVRTSDSPHFRPLQALIR